MPSARHEEYVSAFSARYVSPEMSYLFSEKAKISTFRRLWVSLAKAEQKLGLPITHQQIAELEDNVEKIDFAAIRAYEKRFRHDVMAHIHAFGDQCPKAKPIIHLGATSCYVTDNADLIQMKKAHLLLFAKLMQVLRMLAKFAESEAASICLGFTHFQSAQPTTIGKRICLWLQDFLMDAREWEKFISDLPFLGAKGATGTSASFLHLLDSDSSKVEKLESLIAKDFGFTKILKISGQTYTRKIDLILLNLLESFAASAHKMATDIRLLAHEGEVVEKFEKSQIGSSAMPYKRNPIYSERICGIARFVIFLAQNPAMTLATQWLERSLDDSSNRRLCLPEAFLGADAILNLLIHLLKELKIDREIALKHVKEHLPYLMMENVLMEAVKKGKDRQKVHEELRKLSHKPIKEIEEELGISSEKFDLLSLIGCASDQVRSFLKEDLDSFLKRHKSLSAHVPPIEI